MGKRIELGGQVFGRLTVIRFAGKGKSRESKWECQCECGNVTIVFGTHLRSGTTSSCGCLHREVCAEMMRATSTKHGLHKTKEYHTWRSMKQRCNDPNSAGYPHYGGNRIKVCERWNESFVAFLEDVGHAISPQHSLDRYPDNRGHYSCGQCEECKENGWEFNVRWATAEDQANNRRDNVLLRLGDQVQSLGKWARALSLDPSTLKHRLERGWSDEQSLTTPANDHIRYLRLADRVQTLPQWAAELNIHESTLRERLKRGWSDEQTLVTPVRPKGKPTLPATRQGV